MTTTPFFGLLSILAILVPQTDRARIERFHARASATPRLAGSPEDERAAAWIKACFLEAGLEVEEETYDVWLSRPISSSLKLLVAKPITLPLAETGFEWDRDSFNGKLVPAHIAYSKSGKVTAGVVYVHYGLPEDYATLERLGVDVRDRIVLARYGKSFRGVKLEVAEEHGAAAVLLYTDPQDSGYVLGDVYPRGRMAPETAIQRGSAMYIFRYPGDPLTPGEPAVPGVKRLRREAARNLPKITALPISYAAAKPILENLGGAAVPRAWQGGLPFTYHTGPGTAQVELKVENKEASYKIKNVFGVLRGKSGKDGDFVLLGNHRDSWVNGALDPAAGTACMLETATVLGNRAKKGWTPDYTLRFASWGAEEYGVIGSTEYGENHAEFLKKHLVAYVNADSPISGAKFGAASTPSLRGFARSLAAEIRHPDTEQPLDHGWTGNVSELGGGSDFMVFTSRFGTPCLSFEFSGGSGVYHSAFDTHWFLANRIDRGFRYHATLAKLLVLALERLASPETDAYDPAESFRDCIETLGKRAKELPEAEREAVLELARQNLEAATKLRARGSVSRRDLSRMTSTWIDERGLFGREWFRNLYIAPGRRTGYAAVRFPGMVEAIEAHDEARIRHELIRLRERLEAAKARCGELAKDK